MGVRAFAREDLTEVAELYQRVVVEEPGPAPPALSRALVSATLDHPWAQDDLPTLVFEDASGRIAGFQAAYARRMVLDDRPLRMVCCGQLVADPSSESIGIGGLLMRRMLRGAQDFTVTDGATTEVRGMWRRLGGSSGSLTSVGWTRVFHPARLAAHLAARRQGRARPVQGSGALAPEDSADELTPQRLIDLVGRTRLRLRPDYDPEFLDWLFAELEAVDGRGPLARRVVRDDGGNEIGWYVAYLPEHGIGQAMGISTILPDAGPVLDRLFTDARAAGVSAIQGRLEHPLLPALTRRRCLFRRADWALSHAPDDAVAAAIGREQELITRLDGEWWMGYHLGRRKPWRNNEIAAAGG